MGARMWLHYEQAWWFHSTIAQTFIALLAFFGAFIIYAKTQFNATYEMISNKRNSYYGDLKYAYMKKYDCDKNKWTEINEALEQEFKNRKMIHFKFSEKLDFFKFRKFKSMGVVSSRKKEEFFQVIKLMKIDNSLNSILPILILGSILITILLSLIYLLIRSEGIVDICDHCLLASLTVATISFAVISIGFTAYFIGQIMWDF